MHISSEGWNVGLSPKIYYIWLIEKMEKKEMAQIEAHYQKKI